MRLAQDPRNASNIYLTEDNYVWRSTNGGTSWVEQTCGPNSPGDCAVHLHGLAVAPVSPDPNNSVLYVSSGHGNWPGSDPPSGHVWRSGDSGGTWIELTGFPPPVGPCDKRPIPPIETGCYSLYTIAVSRNSADRFFVGTFGHENNVGDPNQGQGIGPVRGTYSGTGTAVWELLTTGLCRDNSTSTGSGLPCPGIAPTPPAKSLYVGTVAIDNTGPVATVYIATLNGIYKMAETDSVWKDISPSFSAASLPSGTCARPYDCRRFESVAVSSINPNLLLAGTSQPLGDGDMPARIFKSTDGGATWAVWTMPTPPNGAPFRAWAQQYRVRDIQIGSTNKAYAVIEGSGIYSWDATNALLRRR